jgi:hypothetical protein
MMVKEWTRSNGRGTLLSISAVISAIFTYIQFRSNGDVRRLIWRRHDRHTPIL